MKHRKLRRFLVKLRRARSRGQALVEFILLLAVLSLISFGFIAVINGSLTRYWEYSVNLIINDRPGQKTVEF